MFGVGQRVYRHSLLPLKRQAVLSTLRTRDARVAPFLKLSVGNAVTAMGSVVAAVNRAIHDAPGGNKLALSVAVRLRDDILERKGPCVFRIRNSGAIQVLVWAAAEGTAEIAQQAVAALSNMAATDGSSQVVIAEAGGIPVLIDLARDGSEEGKTEATGHGGFWQPIPTREWRFAGAILVLVGLARDSSDEGKSNAAGSLMILAPNPENKIAITEAGGVSVLDSGGLRYLCWTLVGCGTCAGQAERNCSTVVRLVRNRRELARTHLRPKYCCTFGVAGVDRQGGWGRRSRKTRKT